MLDSIIIIPEITQKYSDISAEHQLKFIIGVQLQIEYHQGNLDISTWDLLDVADYVDAEVLDVLLKGRWHYLV